MPSDRLTVDIAGALAALNEADAAFNDAVRVRDWGEACGHAVDAIGAGRIALNAIMNATPPQPETAARSFGHCPFCHDHHHDDDPCASQPVSGDVARISIDEFGPGRVVFEIGDDGAFLNLDAAGDLAQKTIRRVVSALASSPGQPTEGIYPPAKNVVDYSPPGMRDIEASRLVSGDVVAAEVWPWPHDEITEDLNALPFVKWDRFVNAGGWCALYGWIERPDDHADFVILIYTPDGRANYTSSAVKSAEIDHLLGKASDHNDCERIEGAFPNVVNVCATALSSSPSQPSKGVTLVGELCEWPNGDLYLDDVRLGGALAATNLHREDVDPERLPGHETYGPVTVSITPKEQA